MQLINQKFTRAEKIAEYGSEKDWGIAVMNSLLQLSGNLAIPNSVDYNEIQVNIDLYNSIFHTEDLERILAPFAERSKQLDYPATPQNYNIIRTKIDKLLGEEIKRPFNFKVISTSPESVTKFEEKRKDLILKVMNDSFMRELIDSGIDIEDPEVYQNIQTPESIEKFMQYTYSDMREYLAQQSLNYLSRQCELSYKFNRGFKDYLLSGTEIFYTGIVSGEPVLYNVDPRMFYCQLSPELQFIEDAQWAYYQRFLTPSQVYEELYEYLEDEDVQKIEDIKNGVGFTTINESNLGVPIVYSNQDGRPGYTTFSESLLRVVHVVWKGLRKIGFLTYIDDNGEQQEEIVDETFTLDAKLKRAGWSIEWRWINEVWEGTKIGNDLFINIRPLPNQNKSLDNPSKCKLPYTGIYRHKSMVSIMKPHQYLYNIIMYRLELTLARSRDKAFLMDIAQIPSSMGIDVKKWLYYLDALGIAFINSHEEGREGTRSAGKTSAFNQFNAIDLSLATQINQYIMILDKLEQMVSEISGIPRQRMGDISPSELVGNVQQAVYNSVDITEPFFFIHNEVKRKALTNLLECAKLAWIDGKKAQYVMDDMSKVFFSIDEGILADSEFGVFISNSSRDEKIKQKLEALSEFALQANKASLSDIITILESESIVETKKKLKESEAKQFEQQQQIEQQKIEQIERIHQEEREDKQLDRELKKYEIDEKTRVALETKDYDNDGDSDGADPSKIDDLSIKYKKVNDDFKLKSRDLDLKEKEIKINKDLKEKEIAVKKIAAKKKPSTSKK